MSNQALKTLGHSRHFIKQTPAEVKTMKKICKDLKEDSTKIINSEKLQMFPLTQEENKLYKNTCYICRK